MNDISQRFLLLLLSQAKTKLIKYMFCILSPVAVVVSTGYEVLSLERIDEIKIGDTKIHTILHEEGDQRITYLNMHENEKTSVTATQMIIRKYGGRLIELAAQGKREIYFTVLGEQYGFDPNRIFTDIGIERTLHKYGRYSRPAHEALKVFANTLLMRYSLNKSKLIIAVHNNSEGGYSILSYVRGGPLESDARLVHVNKRRDPDDFLLVSGKRLFEYFREKGFNVVLQNDRMATDDGSLSIYCSKHGILYINVEAEYGHLAEQIEMLEAVQSLVN